MYVYQDKILRSKQWGIKSSRRKRNDGQFQILKILSIKFFIYEYLNLHWIHIERIYNFYLKSLIVEIKLKFCSFQLFKFSEGFLETTKLYNGEYHNRNFLITCKQRSLQTTNTDNSGQFLALALWIHIHQMCINTQQK